jgi:hypothetical protein
MVVEWTVAGVVLVLLVAVLLFAVIVLSRLWQIVMRHEEPQLQNITNDDFPFVAVLAMNALQPMLEDALCKRLEGLNIADNERHALKQDLMGIALAYGEGCAARAVSGD